MICDVYCDQKLWWKTIIYIYIYTYAYYIMWICVCIHVWWRLDVISVAWFNDQVAGNELGHFRYLSLALALRSTQLWNFTSHQRTVLAATAGSSLDYVPEPVEKWHAIFQNVCWEIDRPQGEIAMWHWWIFNNQMLSVTRCWCLAL